MRRRLSLVDLELFLIFVNVYTYAAPAAGTDTTTCADHKFEHRTGQWRNCSDVCPPNKSRDLNLIFCHNNCNNSGYRDCLYNTLPNGSLVRDFLNSGNSSLYPRGVIPPFFYHWKYGYQPCQKICSGQQNDGRSNPCSTNCPTYYEYLKTQWPSNVNPTVTTNNNNDERYRSPTAAEDSKTSKDSLSSSTTTTILLLSFKDSYNVTSAQFTVASNTTLAAVAETTQASNGTFVGLFITISAVGLLLLVVILLVVCICYWWRQHNGLKEACETPPVEIPLLEQHENNNNNNNNGIEVSDGNGIDVNQVDQASISLLTEGDEHQRVASTQHPSSQLTNGQQASTVQVQVHVDEVARNYCNSAPPALATNQQGPVVDNNGIAPSSLCSFVANGNCVSHAEPDRSSSEKNVVFVAAAAAAASVDNPIQDSGSSNGDNLVDLRASSIDASND